MSDIISLWKNSGFIAQSNLRLNEMMKRESNFSLLKKIVHTRFQLISYLNINM